MMALATEKCSCQRPRITYSRYGARYEKLDPTFRYLDRTIDGHRVYLCVKCGALRVELPVVET